MASPYNVRREVFDVDKMLAASDAMLDVDGLDVDGILAKLMKADEGVSYRPKDEDLRNFWLLWRSTDGRKLIEWWLDMTLRAPYPHVGNDLQVAALVAAKFQARASLGEVLLEALAAGKKIYEKTCDERKNTR